MFFVFFIIGAEPKAQVAASTEDNAFTEVRDRQSAVSADTVSTEGSLFRRTRTPGNILVS